MSFKKQVVISPIDADKAKKDIYDTILNIWDTMKSIGFERGLSSEEWNEILHKRVDILKYETGDRFSRFYRALYGAMVDYYEELQKIDDEILIAEDIEDM